VSFLESGHELVTLERVPRAAFLSRERTVLGALIVLGGVLRFSTLGVQSFDIDESVTVSLLHQGLGGMLKSLPHTESTPPLYYLVAWLWSRLFGLGEVGLRSLSAVFGTLMIPLAHTTARRLISRRAGLIAAALTAVSPWLLWYSQEARAYALFALLGLASFAAFLRARDDPSRGSLAAWALLSALALATHYFALFMIGPEALWLLADGRARRSALAAGAFVAAAGLALMPLALEQAHGIRAKAGFLQTPLSSRLSSIPTRFLLGEGAPSGGRAALVALAALLLGASLFMLLTRQDEEGRRGALVALAIGSASVLLPVILALIGRDYLDARNLVAAWVPLAVLAAAGYAAAGRAGLLAASAVMAIFLLMVLVGAADSALQRTDYRGAIASLGPSPGPGERTIVVTPAFNWTPFTIYLPGYPRLGPGNVGVREIDLVGWRTQTLSGATVQRLAGRGFLLAGDRLVQKLRVVRFLAPRALSVSRAELLRSSLSGESATVLIQGRTRAPG
jgi:mannosyltransferase